MSNLNTTSSCYLEAEITAWKNLIEQALDKHLPPAEKPPEPPVHEAIRYSTLGGGHRYRPLLTLAVAEAYNVNQENALSMACIVEMIHSSSMILDDLPSFDNAEIRHGKHSSHRKFGEYISILASHRLTSLTLEIYRHLRNELGHQRGGLLEIEYTNLINAMIKGEVCDLATRKLKISVNDLINIYKGKSATLFSFAAVSGAILGNADSDEVESLRQYGINIGLAYQILDDVYDVKGGPNGVGKNMGMDKKNGKQTTFPILYGVDESVNLMKEYKSKGFLRIDNLGRRFETLKFLSDQIAPNI